MREELNFDESANVSGGKYSINGDAGTVSFLQAHRTYTLKCSPYQAMELMDSLIGQYPTEKEYDKACIKALAEKGWI